MPADGDVDAHVALGHRLSQLGRYEEAVGEFRRAYELRADPRLLFEIAETYRRLGASDQARFYYERYLASAPAAADRDEVEAKIAALQRAPRRARPRPRMVSEAALVAPRHRHRPALPRPGGAGGSGPRSARRRHRGDGDRALPTGR